MESTGVGLGFGLGFGLTRLLIYARRFIGPGLQKGCSRLLNS